MIRARFYSNSTDYRPIKWPIKYPYWCTGFTLNNAIIVAYADSIEEIKKLWPEAININAIQVDKIEFSNRFPKPAWYKEKSNQKKEITKMNPDFEKTIKTIINYSNAVINRTISEPDYVCKIKELYTELVKTSRVYDKAQLSKIIMEDNYVDFTSGV